MSRPRTRRVLFAVFLGVLATGPVIVAWRSVFYGMGLPEMRAFIGLGVLLFSLWLIVTPLMIAVMRKLSSVTMADAIVGSTLLFAGLHVLVAILIIQRGPIDRMTGEPCGDDGSRKVVTSMRMTEAGGQVTSYDCVSQEEFSALNLGGERVAMILRPLREPENVLNLGEVKPSKVLERLGRLHTMARSLLLGVAFGIVVWLNLFGWRWRARIDT